MGLIPIPQTLASVFIVLVVVGLVHGDYDCVCNYNVEEPVYSQPSVTSVVAGTMYEFDCKPLYNDVNHSDASFQAVQFEHKIVYIPVSNTISTQICQGSIPDADKVITTPTTTATTTTHARSTTTIIPLTTTMPPTNTYSKTGTTIKQHSATNQVITTKPTSTIVPSTASLTQNQTTTKTTRRGTSALYSNQTTITTTQPSKTATSSISHVSSTKATTFTSTQIPTIGVNVTSTTQLTNKQSTVKPIASSTDNPTTATPALTTTTIATSTPATSTNTTTDPPTTHLTNSKFILSTTSSQTSLPSTSTTIATTTTTSTAAPTTTVSTTISPSTTRVITTRVPSTTLLSIMSTSGVPQCPSGWTKFKSSCYKFHTSGRTTWDIANADCISQRSHIVFVETDDEDTFLRSFLSSHIDIHIHDNSDTGTWLGATERHNVGRWVWRDSFTQKDTDISYNRWHPGQPDSDNEHCAAMIGRLNFEWHDYECSQSMYYVCESAVTGTGSSVNSHTTVSPLPAVNTHTLANCDGAWTQYKDSCYLFVTDQGHLEWDWANDYCKDRHSHLAIIESREEDMFLANQMRGRIDTDDDDDEDTGVWLGGTDEDREGRWVWRDSLRHTDSPISGYTNWYPGEPDSGDHDKEEDCLCMIGSKGFQWQDYRCRDNMFAICEKPRAVVSLPSLVG